MRAGQIVHALRLRTHRDRLRVRQSCASAADWIVRVGSGDSTHITVAMHSQQGSLIHESWLVEVSGREATEVAHTVSLKVIEALAPLAPELLTTAPVGLPEVLVELPPPVTVEEASGWAAGVGVSTLVSWPEARPSIGVTVHLEVDPGRFLAVGEASWWSPIQRHGSDYELHVHQSGIRAGVGGRIDVAGARVALTGGVLGRFALLRARGEHVEVGQRWLVDPGLDVQVDASVRAGPVRIGLALSFGAILRNPQLLVDNVGVVDVGHVLAVAALRVAYPW